LHGTCAEVFRKVSQFDRGLEGGMRNSDHDRHAFIDAVDGVADERFAFFEAEIGVFLGLDPGRNHHGGAAVPHHIVDLAPQRGLIDIEVPSKGSEWRNNQSRLFHVDLPPGKA
jgi:hypothetical protein